MRRLAPTSRAAACSSRRCPPRAVHARSGRAQGRCIARAARCRARLRHLVERGAPLPPVGAGRMRCTRPPSWSMRMGAIAPQPAARRSEVSARSCVGSTMLRAKRMKPQGCAPAKKRASSGGQVRALAAEDGGREVGPLNQRTVTGDAGRILLPSARRRTCARRRDRRNPCARSR